MGEPRFARKGVVSPCVTNQVVQVRDRSRGRKLGNPSVLLSGNGITLRPAACRRLLPRVQSAKAGSGKQKGVLGL